MCLKVLPDKISCPKIVCYKKWSFHVYSDGWRQRNMNKCASISWSSCLWKLCELVSNIEEQLRIVFVYTGNLYHLHDLAIWKWLKNVYIWGAFVWTMMSFVWTCKRSFLVARDFDIRIFFQVYFNWEELKWLQICKLLIEIIFILFLKTALFYNCMLPVKRYLAMNTFRRSMT
jgi:hypothetical protein